MQAFIFVLFLQRIEFFDVYKAINIPTADTYELVSQTAVNQSEVVTYPPPKYPLQTDGEPTPKVVSEKKF